MRRWIKITIPSVVLAAGVVLCAVRWQAWFGMPAEPVWTGNTIVYDLLTFARDTVPGFTPGGQGWQDELRPEQLDIIVFGDIHTNMECKDYDLVAARVPQADAVIQIGDWLHRGQEYYRQLLLREWTPSKLCRLPIINCPGNHEYSKGLNKTLSPVWSDMFPQPDNGPVGVPGKHYYVDFPNLRVISIDSNPLVRIEHLTRVLTWLHKAMNSAGDRYVVVMMHHPVYSVAKGRFNSLIYATFRYALGQTDLALSGHDHNYMRRTPFVVINTAGRVKEQRFRFQPDVIDSEPVYGVLSVRKSEMAFRVYRLSDGVEIDSMYVKHD